VIIVDSAVVAVGSFNFSQNASTSNDENLVIIHDPTFAASFEEEFNRQMATAVTRLTSVYPTNELRWQHGVARPAVLRFIQSTPRRGSRCGCISLKLRTIFTSALR
jgi:phosphatidylserine/phosphatidylglycerophosphate/cardiolipin synthase-like enzyme